jgi:hypothetical protein
MAFGAGLPDDWSACPAPIETGRALEQIADPDALGGPDVPALRRLGEWIAGQPMPNQEGR